MDRPHPHRRKESTIEVRRTLAGRSTQELLRETQRFAEESRGRSWWHLISTFAVLAGFMTVAVLATPWPLRLFASVCASLTMVRAFIMFHDLHHGALFRHAPVARFILNVFGLLMVTPAKIWRDTHNYHHAHTAKLGRHARGSYEIYTLEEWREASPMKRLHYRIERHPITLLLGYFTVFLLSFGIVPFFSQPKRFWDSGLSLLLHIGLGTAILVFGGFPLFLYVWLIPFTLSGMMGAYLFYVQHNFEGMQIPDPDKWDHADASLGASSYLKFGPVMQWFTGNIGFHHVHHLDPRVPFYRLPEAMDAIPELGDPTTVRLTPGVVVGTFRMKLWDPAAGKMVGYGAAKAPAATRGADEGFEDPVLDKEVDLDIGAPPAPPALTR